MYPILPALLLCGWLSVLPALSSQSATRSVSAAEAKAHVGEAVEVCGVVASIREPRRSKRTPTFLNFDKPYPATEFTAIIWREDRSAFGNLRAQLGRKICVTGQVREYHGRAQMTLKNVDQLAKPGN